MKWTIKLSSTARRDIEQVLDWTLEKFGQRQHDRYVRLIGLALKKIGTNPVSALAKERPELLPEARTLHIARRGKPGRHFFIYRFTPDGHIEVGRFCMIRWILRGIFMKIIKKKMTDN